MKTSNWHSMCNIGAWLYQIIFEYFEYLKSFKFQISKYFDPVIISNNNNNVSGNHTKSQTRQFSALRLTEQRNLLRGTTQKTQTRNYLKNSISKYFLSGIIPGTWDHHRGLQWYLTFFR